MRSHPSGRCPQIPRQARPLCGRTPLETAASQACVTPDSGTRSRVKEIVASRLGQSPEDLDENATLETAMFDSLLMVETVTAVEREFGSSIDLASLADAVTPLTTLAQLMDDVTRCAVPAGQH
ncbi:acyl carrier protein [Streptomyces sp. NPDC048269]|uniref:acyl carrier protein n=1 Tax=Streptomyces sp. NPDC048269 TaxID=3155753 RepID=UPI003416B3E7